MTDLEILEAAYTRVLNEERVATNLLFAARSRYVTAAVMFEMAKNPEMGGLDLSRRWALDALAEAFDRVQRVSQATMSVAMALNEAKAEAR